MGIIERIKIANRIRKGRIFISYRKNYSQWQAMSLGLNLRHFHQRALQFDIFNLEGGEDILSWSLKAITLCRFFVPLFSKGCLEGADGSFFVKEIIHALNEGRYIASIALDGYELHKDQNRLKELGIEKLLERRYLEIHTPSQFENVVSELNIALNNHKDIKEIPLSKEAEIEFKKLYDKEINEQINFLENLGHSGIRTPLLNPTSGLITGSSSDAGINWEPDYSNINPIGSVTGEVPKTSSSPSDWKIVGGVLIYDPGEQESMIDSVPNIPALLRGGDWDEGEWYDLTPKSKDEDEEDKLK